MEGASDIAKVKVKIGEHEFEAEGPAELVKSQFEAFKEIISSRPAPQATNSPSNTKIPPQVEDNTTQSYEENLQKLLHISGRVVSLTALPASFQDAALLIMLGHKEFRTNLSVTGQEIGDGLDQSGKPVLRVDRIMEKAMDDAFVLKTGIKRGTRYKLTNQGVLKAQSIAKELLATLS